MRIFSIRKRVLPGIIGGAFGLMTAAASVTPASADRITATCARIAGISSAEANYLYYEAEAEFGAGAAGRLYGAYHQLRNKCQTNPRASITLNVQPRVRAFFEARR